MGVTVYRYYQGQETKDASGQIWSILVNSGHYSDGHVGQ